MVVVTHHPGNSPRAVLVLPEVDEAAFADTFGIFVAGMMETMNAHFNRSIAFHVKDLQGGRQEFARRLTANVFLYAFGQGRAAKSNSTLIVIELDVFVEELGKRFQIAGVVSVEHLFVQSRDGLVQVGLRLDLVERKDSLAVPSRCEEKQYCKGQAESC